MPSNTGYDSTGEGNQNDNDSRSNTTSSNISTIARAHHSPANEGTLLTVNSNDAYFSDEKVQIPDVDKVMPDSVKHLCVR